jgi:hypothetical protein
VITVEVVARERSWPCRLLRHRTCRTAYPSPRAVAYPDPKPRFPVVGWLRCPCPCHGELPTHPRAEESA